MAFEVKKEIIFASHAGMNLDKPELEDDLGDVLEKAVRQAALGLDVVARESNVELGRIKDALDYRSELTCSELTALARVLRLNEVGLCALAGGRYPLPEPVALPFCLHPLRMPFGVGVANAYLCTLAGSDTGVLFDTGASHAELHRAWPVHVTQLGAAFVTHYEAEHIGGLATVLRESGLERFYGPATGRWSQCLGLGEGEVVNVEGMAVTALHTPGHAAEHNCYVVRVPGKAGQVLISGDLIFAGSLGGGYYCCQRQLKNSRRVLEGLPGETIIAPGHGPLTTVENERRFNPFLV